MSVTFFADGAPDHLVAPYPDEPDFFQREPVAPFIEINLANGNARDILEMIDPAAAQGDLCGTWKGAKLAEVLSSIDRLRSNPAALATLVEPSFITRGARGATLVECGRNLGYVKHRLEQFHTLCTLAQQHGYPVCFG